MGPIQESKSLSDVVAVGIVFVGNSIPETVLRLDVQYIKRPYVTAVLQVSILNGTDLKTVINYTGEQVSQRTPISGLYRKKLLRAPLPVFSLSSSS